MIISPRHRFVFVHIPKCAGTSVRTQLIKCDPDHISLGEVGVHPVLGTIDFGHIQLSVLRQHFPEYYANLLDYTSFAVLRDPLARFGSALRQVLWRFEKRPMTLIPPAELRERTLRLLDEIAAEIDAPSPRLIFFARQTDFVFDEGRRLVDHLIPLDLVAEFLGYMERRTGVPLVTSVRSNQNVELRFKSLGPLAFRVNHMLRRTLPLDVHARIKNAAVGLLARPGDAAEASGVLDLPEVRDFVATEYAGDADLYSAAARDRASISSALAGDRLETGPGAAVTSRG